MMNSIECYRLNMQLMAAEYVPAPCRNGKPILRVSGMPTEGEVRRWSGELGVTETGIVDLATGRVTLVIKVPQPTRKEKRQSGARGG